MPRDDRYAGRRILTGKGGAASAAPLPSNASKEGNEPARLADQFAFRHYRKMLKRLSNYGEQRVHDEIVATADHYAANIYRKVRLADVIDISKLPSRELGRFALQSHFDFCICDDSHMPAFAIEFDGSGSFHGRPDRNIVAWEWDFDAGWGHHSHMYAKPEETADELIASYRAACAAADRTIEELDRKRTSSTGGR